MAEARYCKVMEKKIKNSHSPARANIHTAVKTEPGL